MANLGAGIHWYGYLDALMQVLTFGLALESIERVTVTAGFVFLGFWWEVELSFPNTLCNPYFIFSIKWILALRKKLVSYDSEGPNVAFFVVAA